MNEVLMILGMFLVTFGGRYPPLALVGRLSMPEGVRRGLKFVPPAVLTAIIVPAMLMPGGEGLELSLNNSFLAAGLVSGLAAWRSKKPLATILIGMMTLWGWRWLLGMGVLGK